MCFVFVIFVLHKQTTIIIVILCTQKHLTADHLPQNFSSSNNFLTFHIDPIFSSHYPILKNRALSFHFERQQTLGSLIRFIIWEMSRPIWSNTRLIHRFRIDYLSPRYCPSMPQTANEESAQWKKPLLQPLLSHNYTKYYYIRI